MSVNIEPSLKLVFSLKRDLAIYNKSCSVFGEGLHSASKSGRPGDKATSYLHVV